MKLDERAKAWRSVWRRSAPTEQEYLELAQGEQHATLPYIVFAGCRMSPLGVLVSVRNEGKRALRHFLEHGADPGETACIFYDGKEIDAFQFAKRQKNTYKFCRLLKYGTPSRCADFDALMIFVRDKYRQNDAGHAVAWCFRQIQREDLVQPVVQRLARTSLHEWAAPSQPKKLKLEK
jgi:hypothetical protein